MVKVRQDAWSHEDDLLLAETVLRHIREGSTQLNAFDEVGDKLNRTSAACGFRWNAEVRTKYESAIDLAKRQRKEKKRAMSSTMKKSRVPAISLSPVQEESKMEEPEDNSLVIMDTPVINIDMVIQFLRELKKDYHASNQSKSALEDLEKENSMLQTKVKELEKQLSSTEEQMISIQEDYQTFIQIMDRARKMTVLDDKGSHVPPTFRMDKNGNLEQLAQGSN
ncbi:RsfA family transcriptional regulator [Oceanobacillus damuensis]|uniref:RsfA family transcriptional regulator n=1 Tax=Oceanobacillus damuensis TaxID=937928 RepID=UPI000830B411|nr:RsfA family transcriptional regulator [Oceanobacillus damuensis]